MMYLLKVNIERSFRYVFKRNSFYILQIFQWSCLHVMEWEEKLLQCLYRIDKKHKLVIGIGRGVITKQEMLEYLHAIKEDKDFDPSYDFIEETKDVTEIRLSSAELQELAQVSLFNRESRRARIAANDLFFAISRMYEAYRELTNADNFFVFRNKENALQWINQGRKERQVEPLDLSFDPFAV
jgi:hypothetical protein